MSFVQNLFMLVFSQRSGIPRSTLWLFSLKMMAIALFIPALSLQVRAEQGLSIEKSIREYVNPLSGRNYYFPLSFHARSGSYGAALFVDHVRSIWIDTLGLTAGLAVIGIKNWDWGSSGFHFHSEGWFGKDTGSGGIDKLGHAYSSALLADFFTDRIRQRARDPRFAALTGSLLSLGMMTAVEVFDGFASDHGFSKEDMIVDVAGIAFSFARNMMPDLRKLVDFRQEYFPVKYDSRLRPLLGYESKRFLLAFKLSGVQPLHDTPLQFLELHAGYFARGFSRKARLHHVPKRRHLYVGVGVNLGRLLFGRYEADESVLKWAGRFLLEHQQMPFTSFGTGNSFYRRNR